LKQGAGGYKVRTKCFSGRLQIDWTMETGQAAAVSHNEANSKAKAGIPGAFNPPLNSLGVHKLRNRIQQ